MIKFEQKQIIIGGIIVAIIIGTIGYYLYTTLQNNEEEIIKISEENIIEEEVSKEEENQIIVHIAGEVKKPGIIKINEGARIADIIDKAGGLDKQADITNINLAYEVEDGQKIIIPKIGDLAQEYITQESQTNSPTLEENTNKKVNLNKATLEQLQTLPGIRRIHCSKNNNIQKRKWGL